jgi:hypothetical protein
MEQPNMLAQMGQMMGIRQAQQQYEEQNALRDAFAQGADIRDPEAFKRIASINPKLAYDLRSRHIEQQQKGVEIGLKTNEALGAALGGLVQNPTLDYAKATFSHLVSTGVLPPDKAEAMYAKLEAEPNRIKEYATLGVNAAISAKEKMTDATSRRNTDVSSGAAYGQLALAQKKFDLEQTQQAELSRILRGEAPIGAPSVTNAPIGGGGGSAVTGGPSAATPVGAGSVPTGASAVTPVAAPAVAPNVNALNATPGAPAAAGNVNALTEGAVPPQIAQMQSQIGQLIRVGTPKALAAADALIKQHNMLMPSQQIVQNTKGEYIRVDQRGGSSTPVLDASGQPLVGKLPPPVFESEYTKLVGQASAKRDIDLTTNAASAQQNLPKIYETLDQLRTSDAITGFGANMIKTIEAARAKFANDIKSGKKVADTEILDAMLGSEVFPMIGTLGIGAKGLDTPAEREFLRNVLTGTITLNKDTLIKMTQHRMNLEERAVKRYNEAVDSGKLDRFFETQGIKPEKIEPPKYEPQLKQVDQDALNWAKTNPKDPRAAQILQRLGM